MNPMTNVKNIQRLNERMLEMGVADDVSWHKQYKDSAYIFIGGLPYDLTEGDILCVFSQYGEIVNINLVRDKKTGKQKGFCFLCYEDQRSTILAVDNFNGIKLGGRTIRVDHCADYRRPKGDEKDSDGNRKEIIEEGCAPKTPSPSPSEDEEEYIEPVKKKKKSKKGKSHKNKSKKRKKQESASESETDFEIKHKKHKENSNKTSNDERHFIDNRKRNNIDSHGNSKSLSDYKRDYGEPHERHSREDRKYHRESERSNCSDRDSRHDNEYRNDKRDNYRGRENKRR